jgi:hypothetical protein
MADEHQEPKQERPYGLRPIVEPGHESPYKAEAEQICNWILAEMGDHIASGIDSVKDLGFRKYITSLLEVHLSFAYEEKTTKEKQKEKEDAERLDGLVDGSRNFFY